MRTALTPRYLGLLVLVLVVVGVFVQLGRWQLGVAEDSGRQEALERARTAAPVPLVDVLRPFEPFPGELSTRPVTATGHYTDGQLLVPDRRLDGVAGSWVLTPFVVDATGATLPVLRGFVQDPADAGPPPEGPRTVRGGLAPPESPSDVVAGVGEIGSVDTSVLVNTWPGDLYNGFLFLAAEDPADPTAPTRVPTPVGPTGVDWRNAMYGIQWWVFAGFALWLWWRTVREAHLASSASPDGPAADGPGDEPSAPTGDNGLRERS